MVRHRRIIKSILPILLAPGAAFAGAPVPYDEWSVTAGIIDTTASCSNAGISCKTIVEDNGFKYEQITAPDYEYFRIILTEPDADGTGGSASQSFSTEMYTYFTIANRGIQQGVAAKQVVTDSADGFRSAAIIQKGNFRTHYTAGAADTADMFVADLDQTIDNSQMVDKFRYRNYTEFSADANSNNPDTDKVAGFKLDLDQLVYVGEPGDTSKTQDFEFRSRSGREGNPGDFFFFGGGNFAFVTPPAGQPTGYSFSNPIIQGGSATLGVAGTAYPPTTVTWVPSDSSVAARSQVISNMRLAQSSNFNTGIAEVAIQRIDVDSNGAAAGGLTSAYELRLDVAEPVDPFVTHPDFTPLAAIP